eukprot:2494307-Ditylum_brightwellii.AAC.1
MAALNKAEKNKTKEKEVEINAFNKFCPLNVEISDEECELKESAPPSQTAISTAKHHACSAMIATAMSALEWQAMT